MEKEIKRSIQLICSILLGSRDPAIVPYTPTKTSVPGASTRYFKRTAPYKKGVSAGRIQNFLSELEATASTRIHSVMVLKDGEIICEASAPGYDCELVHLAHSMSKTVTGIAVAILADEEKLNTDTTVSEIFTDLALPSGVGSISVGDLMRMSSGMSFSEIGAVTSVDWTRDFFSSEQSFAHGEGYRYNSMNSYILARIVERVSGLSFEDFLRAKLFTPLKITEYLWEKSPEGTQKGGWGLYLSLEDWLKIASLFITGGKFEETQIISHISMLDFLLARNEHSAENDGNFDYAGHISIAKNSKALLMNGLFGQNVYIEPTVGLAVAVNSGCDDLFKNSSTLDIIMKYFPPDMNDTRLGNINSWRSLRSLLKKEKNFFGSRGFVRVRKNMGLLEKLHLRSLRFPEEWNALLGKYLLPMNNAELLPIIVRLMQNNLEGGIDTVEFLRVGNLPHIRLTLGECVRDIPIGIYSHAETELDFHGEKYRVRTLGGIEDGEDGRTYRIEFVFPELPNTRTLTVKREGDSISMVFGEMPGADAIIPFIDKFSESSNMAALVIGMIERKLGEGFIKRKLYDLFSPALKAPSERAKDADEILAAENAKIEKERSEILAVPFISNFIRTEIKENTGTEEAPKKKKGFFGFIASIFRHSQRLKDKYDEIEDDEDFVHEFERPE